MSEYRQGTSNSFVSQLLEKESLVPFQNLMLLEIERDRVSKKLFHNEYNRKSKCVWKRNSLLATVVFI